MYGIGYMDYKMVIFLLFIYHLVSFSIETMRRNEKKNKSETVFFNNKLFEYTIKYFAFKSIQDVVLSL